MKTVFFWKQSKQCNATQIGSFPSYITSHGSTDSVVVGPVVNIFDSLAVSLYIGREGKI